ncbi:MAG: RNA polymerase sigma factor [Saprospiraceae bacterium]
MNDSELKIQFQNIIDQHKGILVKVVRSYCKDANDRQDLMQEIMIQIWKALPRYNHQFAITTWLYRISLNVAISFYRKNTSKKSKSGMLANEFLEVSDSQSYEKDHALKLLEQFIYELNDIDKSLILLYLEDKSYKEISEVMGLSTSNIATKMGRIKDKLKNNFLKLNFKFYE